MSRQQHDDKTGPKRSVNDERAGKRPQLPRLGFGTSGIAGLYRPVSRAVADEVLETAWSSGFRYFDTAPHYGQGAAERRLGDFLREKPQDDFILSTKVGRNLTPSREKHRELNAFIDPLPFDQHYDYTYDGVMRSVEDSYQRLGLNQIDILYVHEIGQMCHGSANERYRKDLLSGGWKALETLKEWGAVRAIGLGVNEIEICLELAPQIDIDVILLAGRYTLLDQSAAATLLPLCAERKIDVVLGGIFNSGILATGPVRGAHFEYAEAPDDVAKRVTQIAEVCGRHGVSLPQAALHFAIGQPLVASVLVSAADADVVEQNARLADSPPPPEFWADMAASGLLQTHMLPLATHR